MQWGLKKQGLCALLINGIDSFIAVQYVESNVADAALWSLVTLLFPVGVSKLQLLLLIYVGSEFWFNFKCYMVNISVFSTFVAVFCMLVKFSLLKFFKFQYFHWVS